MAQDDYRIETASPAGPDLMFWTLAGHEALSQPSCYELQVLSRREDIAAGDILGHAFDVVMHFPDAGGAVHQRHCQGHAVRFSRRGRAGRYFAYAITLRSWFWLLNKRVNSRIFQGRNALEVFEATLDEGPLGSLKKLRKDGVVGPLALRPYCVQHQESDFQFLSRLLEDEGIYYWFDAHEEPGTLLLADASDLAHQPLPVAPQLDFLRDGTAQPRYNEVRDWFASQTYDSGRYASQDSDFKAIRRTLRGASDQAAEHELSTLEMFEFPGGHLREADADRLAKSRMEALAARRRLCWATTPWADVAVGRHTRLNAVHGASEFAGEQLIVSCLIAATHPGYDGVDTSAPADLQALLLGLVEQDRLNAEHRDELAAIVRGTPALSAPLWGRREFLITTLPLKTPFRPPRTTPRVRMPGPQTAIVVGPEGKEIHADDFGRVKLHFPWDRYDRSNEKSTCWVRVSQPWAGKGWGAYFIPRIGQEVIVDFLNGDPDRPIVMGRAYNDDQPIPFKSHTQSGIRTRSTPSGGVGNFNELRFDDEKGKEQVYLHAERNQDIEVEADESHWVGHDRSKTVDHDETVQVKNNRSETVGADETIAIGRNRTESVGADERISVGASRDEQVGANETIAIGANRSETVGANESWTVGGNRTDSVGANQTQSAGGNISQTAGANFAQTAGAAMTLSSGGPMTLSATGGLNIIAPGGTKVVDFQFLQFGGNEKVGYATSLNFSLVNTEINMLKGEFTDIANALIPIKFEKVGVENKQAATAIRQLGVEIASGVTKIVTAAMQIHL